MGTAVAAINPLSIVTDTVRSMGGGDLADSIQSATSTIAEQAEAYELWGFKLSKIPIIGEYVSGFAAVLQGIYDWIVGSIFGVIFQATAHAKQELLSKIKGFSGFEELTNALQLPKEVTVGLQEICNTAIKEYIGFKSMDKDPKSAIVTAKAIYDNLVVSLSDALAAKHGDDLDDSQRAIIAQKAAASIVGIEQKTLASSQWKGLLSNMWDRPDASLTGIFGMLKEAVRKGSPDDATNAFTLREMVSGKDSAGHDMLAAAGGELNAYLQAAAERKKTTQADTTPPDPSKATALDNPLPKVVTGGEAVEGTPPAAATPPVDKKLVLNTNNKPKTDLGNTFSIQ